jgi:hypothetical protein
MHKNYYFIPLFLLLGSCFQAEKNCSDFHLGNYQFTTVLGKDTLVSRFERFENYEVEYFNEKIDTSTVRWVNDCEYILKNKNPKNMSEQKSVSIRILSTTDSTYTFEYGIVGQSKKSKGTAKRIK